MTDDPVIHSQLAHDLSKLDDKSIADLQRESKERQDENEQVMAVVAWNRGMRRAFKGIMPRKTALAALARSVKKHGLDKEE